MPSTIKKGLRWLGLIVMRSDHPAARYAEDPPQDLFGDILLRNFSTLKNRRFLQIGANDGIRADRIRGKILRHSWTGLLVEPLPFLFEQLKGNYEGRSGLEFLNAAVDVAEGERPVYFLSPGLPGIPDWAHGLGSFDPGRLRAAVGELALPDSAIVRQMVRTVTWDQLLVRFGPAPCDVLVIDAEGHDIPLLRAAPLGRWRPRVIHFEHACSSEADRLSCYAELLHLGYEIASDEGDTIAWRKS